MTGAPSPTLPADSHPRLAAQQSRTDLIRGTKKTHPVGSGTAVAAEENWRLFSPVLDDSGAVYATLRRSAQLPTVEASASLEKIAYATTAFGLLELRTRAAALLLRDLIEIGWEVRTDGHWIYLRPSASTGPLDKVTIRRQLAFGRDDQLREPPTRRFILGLERPSRFSSCRPVTDLIADGRRLANQLNPIAILERGERNDPLRNICQPYLQLVEGDSRDEFTGLRLIDIWRYFRHNWATRYRSTPGRNLFYLIRDAAQPNHPVMAITALGNAVMQLTTRDNVLGWTIDGLSDLIKKDLIKETELLDSFRSRLIDDIGQIYAADTPLADGIPDQITDDILDRLQVIETQATESRTDRLRDLDDDDDGGQRVAAIEGVDLEAMARTPLFRAKRARALKETLRAYRSLKLARSFADLVANPEGTWAINQALRQLKKQFSATGMMEITVCGAVPPYNHLLGGKLACLMMLSRSVVKDYASRYGAVYSIIASQMAGRPIIKEPALVYLGTSSLFSQHSSQYNRVELTAGAIDGQKDTVRYEDLGRSLGYGSPNLSSETEMVLNELGDATRTYRNVNFVFGEGQSPKMRQLREGFAALGLNRTNILNHGASRIVYGVGLCRNTVRYLLGIDRTPDYSIPETDDCDESIAEFWRKRWLASRLDHFPALESLAKSTPLTERVSRLIPDVPPGGQPRRHSGNNQKEDRYMSQTAAEGEKLAFIRQLYRDESAYSDHVKIGRLRELNVKTALDDVVRKIIRSGGSVVITGNAGDGKTHTIRLLESDLRAANAKVVADASELTQDVVMDQWVAARANNQPFCIAINEGPLIELIRTFSVTHPWLNDIRQQLLRLVSYVPIEQPDPDRYQPKPGSTVVIDLSLRRTLAPELIKRIIDKLTDENWYGGCSSCPVNSTCPVTYNRKMLRTPMVQERLVDLLQHVAERGLRATFRELLAFGSFLIFGGRTCSELLREGSSEQSRYFWHAFEGQGAIFENLELGLDPVRQTNARVDEMLWRGQYSADAFSGNAMLPVTNRNFDEVQEHEAQLAADGYAALKRRWYFEHPEGRLGHATQSDRLFRELQDVKLSPQLRVGRLIALINRWWNRADRDQQDRLRLWTRLSYSPRAHGRAMVSGRDVPNLRLGLFRPQAAPALHDAFGRQAVDHLLLAPPENVRFASLLVDRRLLGTLLSVGVTEQAEAIERRLTQFNDALAQYAESGSHVRTIELLDPESELNVKVRVDLSQRRYDSAQ